MKVIFNEENKGGRSINTTEYGKGSHCQDLGT